MKRIHWSVAAVSLVLAGLACSACEFPECGSERDPNKYPGGFCMGTGSQSAAGSSATTSATTSSSTGVSPRQALIGFRPHPQSDEIVPAWLISSSLGTLDVDALVDGTGPNDQWSWAHDGDSVVFEDHGVTGKLQNLIQLFAPPRDQVLDGVYELVDYDGGSQLLRFGSDGSLVVCDARGARLHEQYAMNGFAFDWTRESGVVEKHAILYDPADASAIWLGSHQLVATRSALCAR